MQEYLKMPFDAVREEHQTAQYLPHPLYVLYMQTSAYREACGKLELYEHYDQVTDVLIS